MNSFLQKAASGFLWFFSSKIRCCLVLLFLLIVGAFVEYRVLGLARRTFVFYTNNDASVVVEDRMLKRSASKEVELERYTQEAILGPSSPELQPLFPYGTRLKSLLYRDGVVFIDFSVDAALPAADGWDTFNSFNTLYSGIFRNFPSVKDIRFFIEGEAAYYGQFEVQHNEVLKRLLEGAL